VDAKLMPGKEIDPVKRMKMDEELQNRDDEAIILAHGARPVLCQQQVHQNLAYDSMGRHFLINT
jgi:hypothetical protein